MSTRTEGSGRARSRTTGTRTPQRVGHGVGISAPRVDGVPKVQGKFAFASDLWAENMLWGHTVRSPFAHAKVLSIDASEALRAPGVRAVLTMDDVPGKRTFGLEFSDQPVMADGVVRYAGEPVAVLAAETPEQARRAGDLVRVEYEDLPVVDDMVAALDPDAPKVHDFGNILRHVHVVHGNPDAEAEVWVEGYSETAMQDNAPLGPEGGLAIPAEDGGIDLYVNTQWLHVDLQQIAPCLALPESKVRITLAGMGGAFGSREDVHLQIHACMLALRTGRPVKMSFGREESFVAHKKRHPSRIWMRIGASRDGRLVNVHARMLIDGGAYASSSPAVIANATTFLTGPYEVPNALLDGTAVYTNNPPCGAMRGFGAPQTCFAGERLMDELADKLGMDRIELRRMNALHTGSVLPTGQVIRGSAPALECLDAVARIPEPPDEPSDGRDAIEYPGGAGNVSRGESLRRGVGWALGYKNIAYSEGFDDTSEARVTLSGGPDGPVASIDTAAVECGQGLLTVLGQIAREELGVDEVVFEPHDTVGIGSAGSSSASRQTFITGGAVQLACREVRDELLQRATAFADEGAALSVEGDRVVADDGRLVAMVNDLVTDPISRSAVFHHRRTDPFDANGQGDIHVMFAFACERAVVEVDTELGLVRVLQIAAAQDVGRALNPQAVHGQIEGGTAQGLGLALMEEVQLQAGISRNASFTDYLIPTILDVPPVESVLIEEPEPDVPFGAKGVGEPATIVATAAVVAAIRAATGLELNRAPVTTDDIVGLRESADGGPTPPPPEVPWQVSIPELHGFGMGQQELMK
ncbi:MAG TPA: xanthine dehydrogenase subunit D [Actinomycetota bacterium]|nr:xanthine dehydrogenase subunit D [Actinomycetota bacterium]